MSGIKVGMGEKKMAELAEFIYMGKMPRQILFSLSNPDITLNSAIAPTY